MKEIFNKDFINSKGNKCKLKKATSYDDADKEDIKEMYDCYSKANIINKKMKCRKMNIPESLSEVVYCMITGVLKTDGQCIKGMSNSGDAIRINDDNQAEIIQIKAYVKRPTGAGPTSFGPRSEYDKLIVAELDDINNIINYYDLSNFDIDNIKVNKKETVLDQKNAGKRPRINIDQIIYNNKLKPFISYNFAKGETIIYD